jgi:hypothetical protein
MARFEDFVSPETLQKMRKAAESVEANMPLTSEQIDELNKDPKKLQDFVNAKRRTAGLSEIKSYVPKSNFEEIVQRLEPSMKMSSETPNVSSKLQALETPVSAAQKITQATEGVSKSNRLKDVISKLSQSSDDVLAKISTPLKNAIASSRILNTGLPALGAYTEGRDALSSLQKGDYTGAAGHALSAGGSAALIPEVGAMAGGTIGLGALPAIGAGASILGYKYLKENSDLPQVAKELKARGISPFQLAKGGDPYTPTKEQAEATKQNEEFNERANSAKPLTEKDFNELQGFNSLNLIPGQPNSTPIKDNLNSILSSIPKPIEDRSSDIKETTDEEKDTSNVSPENQAMLDSMALDQQQSESTVEALRQAQEDAKKDRAQNRLMMAANEILRGALGASYKVAAPEISNKFWEDRLKESDQPIKDLLLRADQEKEDPNSPISKRMREIAGPMLSRLNVKLPETATYAEIQKNFPLYTKMISEQSEQETKAEQRQKTSEEKIEKQDTTRFDKLSKQLDPSRQSGRSQLGRDAQSLAVIQNAKALLKGEKNLNDIDSRQVYEVVRQLDRVVSGGQATITASEHLDPQTFQRQVQTFLEKLTNSRKGAKAGSFLKANLETFDREEQVAKERLEKSALAGASSYKDLMEKYPEKWDEMMADQGLDHILSVNKINEMREKRSKINSGYPKIVRKGAEETEVENEQEEKQANAEGWY